jgi:hypothetical protein
MNKEETTDTLGHVVQDSTAKQDSRIATDGPDLNTIVEQNTVGCKCRYEVWNHKNSVHNNERKYK